MALTTKQWIHIQALFAEANHGDLDKIAQMFKNQRKSLNEASKANFSVGQKVQWSGRTGYKAGTIRKINPKNIVVDAGDAGVWNVSPSLLTAA